MRRVIKVILILSFVLMILNTITFVYGEEVNDTIDCAVEEEVEEYNPTLTLCRKTVLNTNFNTDPTDPNENFTDRQYKDDLIQIKNFEANTIDYYDKNGSLLYSVNKKKYNKNNFISDLIKSNNSLSDNDSSYNSLSDNDSSYNSLSDNDSSYNSLSDNNSNNIGNKSTDNKNIDYIIKFIDKIIHLQCFNYFMTGLITMFFGYLHVNSKKDE